MLAPNPNPTAVSGALPLPRVVLIDYNNASVDIVSVKQGQPQFPESPIQRLWNSYFRDDSEGWVPDEWEDIKFQRRWLVQKSNGDGSSQPYLPLSELTAREIGELYRSEP
jgi:hypothetical protein